MLYIWDTFCDPFIVTYLKAIFILLKLWNFYIYWYCIFVHTQMIYLNCFCVCGGLDFITCSTFLDCICILYSSESYCTPYNLQTWILWFLNLESKLMNEQYLLYVSAPSIIDGYCRKSQSISFHSCRWAQMCILFILFL